MKNLQIFFTEHKTVLMVLLAVLTLFAAAGSLCIGSVPVSLPQLLEVLRGENPDSTAYRIIVYVRFPRVLGCLFSGMALAVAGAVIQLVLSNPLASPNVIGVNSGAGLAVAVCSAALPQNAAMMPWFAFAGAMAGVFLVLLIAEKTGASKMTLILSGIAVSTVFGALIDLTVSLAPDALVGYSDFRIGGFSNISLERVTPALVLIVPALALLFLMSEELDILSLGSETAKSLGLRVRMVRTGALALSAALAGAAVSIGGLISFVGLVVPHLVRNLFGEEARPLLTGSAFGGALLLVLCDTLARTLFAPYEIPVGIVLSLIGGPFFLWLLYRQRGGRSHDGTA